MSPILTRPVREQLEHDRVIRLLHARYKRKYDVVMNPGAEQNQSVTVGTLAVYPDLLLYSGERGRKLRGTVEVETGESVNQLEALAEWGMFSKLHVPLHLYVPPASVDAARRLCTDLQVPVAEVWTFHLVFDQMRFTMAYRAPGAAVPKARPAPSKPAAKAAKPRARSKPAIRPKAGAKSRPAAKSKPVKSTPPAKSKAGKSGATAKTGATQVAKTAKRR